MSCRDEGWVLVVSLLFVLAIMAAVVGSVQFVRYQIQSGGLFVEALNRTHGSGGNSQVVRNAVEMDAPEGWDHVCFAAVFEKVGLNGIERYSWRVKERLQPEMVLDVPVIAAERTGVVIVVDDSESMMWACGQRFDDDAVYLARPGGEIIRVAVEPQGAMWETCDGIYFTGSYGNAWVETPFAAFMGGALTAWTMCYPGLEHLTENLDGCDVALLTTSGDCCDFSRDRDETLAWLAAIRPGSGCSNLAETLYAATAMFADTCLRNRHIVILSDGRSVADGKLPAWLKDYDNDGDPQDRTCRGEGCRCLDDVAAYAADNNIRVHVIGPDEPFLRSVAAAGQGHFMPGAADIVPQSAFICLPPLGGGKLAMTNHAGHFAPAWLQCSSVKWFDADLNPVAAFDWHSPALSSCAVGSALYVATADALMKIDMSSRELLWCISGPGGRVIRHGDVLVAGPDRQGRVTAFSDGPVKLWQADGTAFSAGSGMVYVAAGNTVRSFDVATGISRGSLGFADAVSALAYDPVTESLLVGTVAGMTAVAGADMDLRDTVMALNNDAVRDVRSVTMRKKVSRLILGDYSVGCYCDGVKTWTVHLGDLRILGGVVMAGRLHLMVYSPGSGCCGIDTGESRLLVLDAQDGTELTDDRLFDGMALAPVIELAEQRLCFFNWQTEREICDIARLSGVDRIALGRRVLK